MSSEEFVRLDVIEDYRGELLKYHKEIYNFQELNDPREILTMLSAYSARASWLRFLITHKPSPALNRFRIDALDPFLGEVDRQFKIWSRIQQINIDEYNMSKGQ